VLANATQFRAYPDCVVSSALHYADWPEFLELQWLRTMLAQGDVVLDIGANVGHISLLLADLVSPESLFAFEPAPIAFERLCENWRLNGWPTDQLLRVAVGAEAGTAWIPSVTTPLTTLVVSREAEEGMCAADLRTLDDLSSLWRGRRVGLLKIDVEGFEREVLLGGRRVLTEDRPRVVMFESLSGAVAPEIRNLLSAAGYRVFQLDEHGQPDFANASAQNLFACTDETLQRRPDLRLRSSTPRTSRRPRICVCTSLEASTEPRAPRHAAALAAHDRRVDVIFVDSAPTGKERRAVRPLEGHPNLEWITHRFAVANGEHVKLAAQRSVQALARIAFRIAGLAGSRALSTRGIGLRRILARVEADAYVAHGIEALAPAAEAATSSGALLLFDCMEFHSDMGDGQTAIERALTRAIERRWLPQCDLVLSSSDQVSDALVEVYGIRRPLPLYNVPPTESELPVSTHKELTLYWRNAVLGFGQRGLDDALVAMTQLPSSVSLHLQGRLPTDDGLALRARIEELGLTRRVVVHPPHAPEGAVTSAARFSIGLCLERRGVRNHDLTVSNKIFDYHMAGLATIASDLPGLRAVLERSGGGLLFDPGSPTDLAVKIRRLYDDPDLRAQLAGRAREFALLEANREKEMDRFVDAFWTILDRQQCEKEDGWPKI
jgi:FkbM family methyltransferase